MSESGRANAESSRLSRAVSFLGLNRGMAGLLSMVILVGMGERMAERFLPIYLMALGGGALSVDLHSLPVLPDVEYAEGPLRGMRAAMRWAPRAGWLFTACDQPDVSSAAVEWLLSHRHGRNGFSPAPNERCEDHRHRRGFQRGHAS